MLFRLYEYLKIFFNNCYMKIIYDKMSQICRSFSEFTFSVKVSLLFSFYKYLLYLCVNSKPHPKIMLHQLDQNNSIFGNLLFTHTLALSPFFFPQ